MVGGFFVMHIKKAVGIIHELPPQPFIFVKLYVLLSMNSKRGYQENILASYSINHSSR